MSAAANSGSRPPRISRGPDWPALLWQGAVLAAIVWLGWHAINNAIVNMHARNIPTNFDFWFATAGFDINQSVISYSATSTYGRAFFVGLINTLIVAFAGIVIASVLGFALGVARLSSNWLTAKLASGYVEVIRNTPLLLQLLFWYNAVLKPLPSPRETLVAPDVALQTPSANTGAIGGTLLVLALLLFVAARRGWLRGGLRLAANAAGSLAMLAGLVILLFGGQIFAGLGQGALALSPGAAIFLNNRGLFLPDPVARDGFWIWMTLAGAGVTGFFLFARWSKARQQATGQVMPLLRIAIAAAIVLGLAAWSVGGAPVQFEYAQLRGFNFVGGLRIYPEFVALVLGLSLYTAAFIAEIVRAGILAVARGQSEAALALGLKHNRVLKLVVIPQAMRVIIPPLTNQYLNLTKNSSLAVFIGFPDLVQIFAGTVLNQTGAAVQVILITMGVYLVISLATSMLMNVYNRRMALVER